MDIIFLCAFCGKTHVYKRGPVYFSKAKRHYCSRICQQAADRGTIRKPVKERLLANIAITPSGCWEWQGTKYRKGGYGQITINDIPMGTHRAMWIETNGPIPNGLCVLHRCDNKPCIRPDHLWLGTKGDNNRDAFAKGRNLGPQVRTNLLQKVHKLFYP